MNRDLAITFAAILVGASLMGLWLAITRPTYDQGVYDHAAGVVVIDTLSNGETIIVEVTE